MKTEPAIPLHRIQRHINENYHVNIHTLEFLPIGEGAWCFRGKGDTEVFIRLVKDKTAEGKAVGLARFLHGEGLPVLCSLCDKSGNFMSEIADSGIVVYPFISGSTLMKRSLTEKEASPFRKKVGAIVARLHRITQIDNPLATPPTEDFTKFQAESIPIIMTDEPKNGDALIRELSNFLKVRRRELEDLVEITRKLGQTLRSKKLDYVLCHGDIHEDNVMLSCEGEVFIIDWDNAVLAPRERDLAFFHGDGLSDYLDGYFGHDTVRQIDQTTVDYYALEWALQEIVDYGSRILFDARFDTDGRADAWWQFQKLFEPDGDVDIALTMIRKMKN